MKAVEESIIQLSLGDYRALERGSAARHEYIAGWVATLAGVGIAHNLLTQNLAISLREALRGKGCHIFTTSVQVVAQKDECYTYPDVVISCDEADRQELYQVHRPVLLAEVTVNDATRFDRTEKFGHYQQIPSLRHYLLLSQVNWTVEWFRRDEAGQWIYTLLHDPAAVLEIPDLNLRLPLAELYEDTDVAPLRLQPRPDPGQPV